MTVNWCRGTAWAVPLQALLLLASVAAAEQPKTRVMPNGTFIQWYLVKNWDDATWQAEFRNLRELKMSYLVFAPTVETGQSYYPSQIPGVKEAAPGNDVVDACLRNAERAGVKVFLGLNFHEDWWKKGPNDPPWLYEQMKQGNLVADELYSRYRAKYPHSFYGWYWVWEVDNGSFVSDKHAEVLAEALDINLKHVKGLDPHMPVMLCPYMNCMLGKPEAWGAFCAKVFARCSLGTGDIFAPQDSIGAGGLVLKVLPAWFAEMRKAVDTKPGLRFWVDTETFDQSNWTSATIDRLDKQLRDVAPFVEDGVTFAYSHYYSPHVVNPGWHRALKRYLQTGVVPADKPAPPASVTSSKTAKGVQISWTAAKGPFGDYGYDVFRDGKRIARVEPPKDERPENARASFVDQTPGADVQAHYEVAAYDFYGNTSERIVAGTEL
jgi:hypothetical protein